LLYIPVENANAIGGRIENIGFGIAASVFENLLTD